MSRRLCPATESSTPYFARSSRTQLPRMPSLWHSTRLGHSILTYGANLRSGVYLATTPTFSCPILVKFARFDWEIEHLEKESAAYQWIEGLDNEPKPPGHLLEDQKVIGFMMEHITSARHATPSDLAIC
nr:hypothetical protein CFP56_00901 [Quercus suber]